METLVSYDKLSFKVPRIVVRRLQARNPAGFDPRTSSGSSSGGDSGSSSGKRKPSRGSRMRKLQDLQYTYDASGNITHIKDGARQTVFFHKCRVPSQLF